MNKEFTDIYTDFLRKFLKPKRPLKIVFDCSNGSVGLILKKLLKINPLINYKLINQKPDGNFPGHVPNPMYDEALDDLKRAIVKNKADFGVIFDGDGDRVFFLDDKGRRIIPDVAGYLISKNFPGPILLATIIGFFTRQELKKEGKKTVDCRVGHYFIKKMMRERNIDFGIEHSGHFYFGVRVKSNKLYFDSGILSSIYFINSFSRLNKKLSDWIDNLPQFYRSGETNFKVSDKEGMMAKIEKIYRKRAQKISHLDGLKMEFSTRIARPLGNTKGPTRIHWWFNLRPSNTENLIRLNLESEDKKIFRTELKKIKDLISEK